MKQLSLEERQCIQAQLQAYVAKYPSQNKAVNSLTGVSVGTISTILNGKFENISDEMFLRIRAQVAPAGTGRCYLRANAQKHLVADVLELAVQDCTDRSDADSRQ